MDSKITLDYSYTFPFLNDQKVAQYEKAVFQAMDVLLSKSGAGNDYLGWIDLPDNMLSDDEFQEILKIGNNIYENGDLLICVGIGGSYLGAKAVTDALLPPFYNQLSKEDRSGPRVLFAGQNISGSWMEAILEEMDRAESIYVNVISKSGTTTEPGIAFRNIKAVMEQKYGKIEASKRIIATTDSEKGALKKLANNEGYTTFIIPDDVGGRFSVLTPVGLLPIAAAGIDITKLLQGALEASRFCKLKDLKHNPA
ncbi:MAG: glucose-6-phosphate isomerase, partial [Spirochaetes bacterium]|nr:glucose-6-phosphate isomerase [Spirochaetota bacterium]